MDYIIRTIAKDAGVRAMACISTELSAEGARRHATQPTAMVALGRALTGAALLGALLKVRHRLALKFEGSGPIQKMIVEADAYGKVRGYIANPAVDSGTGLYDLQKAMGEGILTVVKDVKMKDLMESVVPLVTSLIDEDLEFYLNQSEQIASAVQVGVVLGPEGGIAVAGGVLIQNLGDQKGETIHLLAERLQEMPPVAELLHSGQTPETILAQLFGDIPYEVLEKRPLVFKCECSRERSEGALRSLGREEVQQLFEEGQAIVDCHFCHERYFFTRDDLELLLDELP
ncbi:MAG: Hsp33 family molecular chaperone HslO [Chloroflexi bacterium]|nr:Hsp33 family molecular chaperone HslO [Chloroflexota bacterium]